ncbi:MAG: potassium channel family protein [Candidatus Binatus sp.]
MSDATSALSPAALWRQLGLARHNWPGRFTLLLAAILLLLVTQPMFASHAFAQNIATVTILLVLLAALYAVRALRIFFIIALVLIVPAIGCRIALQFSANLTLEMLGAVSSCLFLSVTVVALVSRLFIVTSVTLDTISAAICAYLLMGVGFAYAFAALELRHPGSFGAALFHGTSPGVEPLLASFHSLIYFSFVCLTTTGFGDIAPVGGGARSLSVMESVLGQFYMAILIARLVSLQVAQAMMKERE